MVQEPLIRLFVTSSIWDTVQSPVYREDVSAVVAAPLTPTLLPATDITSASFSVTATPAAGSAPATLWRFQIGGVDVQASGSRTLIVTGIDPETVSAVRVRAENAIGESAWTAAQDVETLELLPPSNVEATGVNDSTIRVTADPMGGVTFRVYGNGNFLGTTLPYDHTGLAPLTSILYTVESVHPNGSRSNASNGAIGTSMSSDLVAMLDESGNVMLDESGNVMVQ